jgi:uncharacterized membrane protein YhaH (DUF805 family)
LRLVGLVSLLFSFSGRINRAQFWLGNIGAGVGGVMLLFMLGVMFMPKEEISKTTEGMLHMLSVMGVVLGPPLMLMSWIGLALQTKRFHDRGRSGLWTMLPLLPATMIMVSVVSGVASGAHPEQIVSSIGMWLLLLQGINLFMFVDLGCMPGQEGPNKYGNPPGSGPSSPSAVPGAPSKGAPAQSIPGMGQSHALVGAESAIDRAIAARAKQAQAPLRAAPRPQSPVPMAPMRAATPGSFGRKVTQ